MIRFVSFTVAFCLAHTISVLADTPEEQSQQLRDLSQVTGGVVVHLGCGEGRLTAALLAGDGFVVHGLDESSDRISEARRFLQSTGKYGRVSVEPFKGTSLPYIDNSVNLIVVEDDCGIDREEMKRVLVPNGVVCVKSPDGWTKDLVKPWPQEIDEWTHYLHDPTNNAVAQDSVIEPPSRYQWLGGPRYSRQHDHMSSVSAVVSAAGRLFYIFDEAPRASILTPPKWKLIGRDAFNGKVLWKRDIDLWHPHLWRLKSGPQLLARRLVAVGDRVYVTLGIDAPLSVLDARTGETVATFDDTKVTEEILVSDGLLLLSVAGDGQPLRSDPGRRYASLAEMNEETASPLWTTAPRTLKRSRLGRP